MKPINPDRWQEVRAATLPAAQLGALAAIRDRTDLRIHLRGDRAWVRWLGDSGDVVRHLLPVTGVEFFTLSGVDWFRVGSLLPAAMPALEGDGWPVSAVLVPQPITATTPKLSEGFSPVAVTIVRVGEPQPVSALECSVRDLQPWTETATSLEIAAVRGAVARDRAILLGPRLPFVRGSTRFWGDGVFVPLGFRAEPDLARAALLEAVGADADEYVFLFEDEARLVPKYVFEPLTRAGLRLAANGT